MCLNVFRGYSVLRVDRRITMELMCVRLLRQSVLRRFPINSRSFTVKSLRWYCVGRSELKKCCTPVERVHQSHSIREFGKEHNAFQPLKQLARPNRCHNTSTRLNTFRSCRLKGNYISDITLHKQLFHTSRSRQALPAPFLWLILKPIQKLLAIILGR